MTYKIIKFGGGIYGILPRKQTVYGSMPKSLTGVFKSREEAQAAIKGLK